MTRVADSSFLIALFDERDRRQKHAKIMANDPEPIEVPIEVLGETLGVVQKRAGFATAAAIWHDLINIPHVELQETADVEAVAEIFLRAKGKLSWVDAAVVAACEASGAEPLCFDDDIVRAIGRQAR